MNNNWQKYTALGIGMTVYIGFATYLGYFLDKTYANKYPFLTIFFILFSTAGAIYKLYKLN